MVDDPALLPQASIVETYTAKQGAYIAHIYADEVAWAAFELGAGREKKGDALDLAVGLRVPVKVGERVEAGQTLATIYANDPAKLAACRAHLDAAFGFSLHPVEPLPLFYDVLESSD